MHCLGTARLSEADIGKSGKQDDDFIWRQLLNEGTALCQVVTIVDNAIIKRIYQCADEKRTIIN